MRPMTVRWDIICPAKVEEAGKHQNKEHHSFRTSYRGYYGEVDDLGHEDGGKDAVYTIH